MAFEQLELAIAIVASRRASATVGLNGYRKYEVNFCEVNEATFKRKIELKMKAIAMLDFFYGN